MTMALGQFGVIKNASLTIAGTEYGLTCDDATLTPSTNKTTRKMLVPAGNISDVDSPEWALSVTGIQDWGDGTGVGGADGFSRYMHENHGENVVVEVAPKASPGEPVAVVTIVAESGPFGGKAGEFAEFEAEYGVQGQPDFSGAWVS